MAQEDLIRMFPVKRISPFDGMAVTAAVWEEAHLYHRQRQQLYDLFSHGPGILTGLAVIASEPPDSMVYILPGIAIDPLGQVVVLTQPVGYDVGQTCGTLYLLLSYGESRPRASKESETDLRYVHAQFSVEAATTVPASACVELARMRHPDPDAPLRDAEDPERPGANEIDLRFRREIGARAAESVAIAVSYLGQGKGGRHGVGAGHLARALRNAGPYRSWADDGVPLSSALEGYTLVYLVGRGEFQLDREEMQALYDYLGKGGTVLFESCRQDHMSGKLAADVAFGELLESLGVELGTMPGDHPLLTQPSLFAYPPAGFETAGSPSVAIGGLAGGEGVIWSTFDYGCLWQGARRGRVASREEIRAAVEWGGNVVTYALQRRRGAAGRGG